MGTVYLADDPLIGRQVAIKLLSESFGDGDLPHSGDEVTSSDESTVLDGTSATEQIRERFTQEARSIGRLRHPNIVSIFDVGEESGQPFIVMEFVPGETLAMTVRKRLHVPWVHRLKLLEDLCRGLSYAHEQGVIHRDVKPANLIIDTAGTLRILDFGIARITASTLTRTGSMMGTLNYMAPEQLVGESVDQRTDVFAVGAVCYEFATHTQAFPGTLHDGLLERIKTNQPPDVREASPDVPPGFAGIIARMLAKAPADRYQTLTDAASDILQLRQRLESDSRGAGETSPMPAVPSANYSPTKLRPVSVPTTPRPVQARSVRKESRRGLWLAGIGLGTVVVVALAFALKFGGTWKGPEGTSALPTPMPAATPSVTPSPTATPSPDHSSTPTQAKSGVAGRTPTPTPREAGPRPTITPAPTPASIVDTPKPTGTPSAERIAALILEGEESIKQEKGVQAKTRFKAALDIDPSNDQAKDGLKRAESLANTEADRTLRKANKMYDDDSSFCGIKKAMEELGRADPAHPGISTRLNQLQKILDDVINSIVRKGESIPICGGGK